MGIESLAATPVFHRPISPARIRRRWPRIAIIVITAGQDTDAAVDCLNAGAYRYFLKPIKLDEFRHALEATQGST